MTQSNHLHKALGVGIPYNNHNENNWALTKVQAIAAIKQLAKQSIPILEIELFFYIDKKLKPTNIVWEYSGDQNEAQDELLSKATEEAFSMINCVKPHLGRPYYFILRQETSNKKIEIKQNDTRNHKQHILNKKEKLTQYVSAHADIPFPKREGGHQYLSFLNYITNIELLYYKIACDTCFNDKDPNPKAIKSPDSKKIIEAYNNLKSNEQDICKKYVDSLISVLEEMRELYIFIPDKIEEVKILASKGVLKELEIVHKIESLLWQTQREAKDSDKIYIIVGNLETAIFSDIEPQKTENIIKAIDEAKLFAINQENKLE